MAADDVTWEYKKTEKNFSGLRDKGFWMSHEFRDVAEFENFYGIAMPYTINTTQARLFVYHAPEKFRIDYKSQGMWEDSEGWVTFDDNNYLIKALPHEEVPTETLFELDTKEFKPIKNSNFKIK